MVSGKKHIPSDEMRAKISALVSFGHTQEEIAKYLGVSVETLFAHYKYEMDNARLIANAEVANRLYAKAVEQDDFHAQKFWLQTRARWRTADSQAQVQSTDELHRELAELRKQLEEREKREY